MDKDEISLSEELGIDTCKYQQLAKTEKRLLKRANKAFYHYINKNRIRFSIALGALRSEVRSIGIIDSIRLMGGQEQGLVDVCILAMIDVYGEAKVEAALIAEEKKQKRVSDIAKELGF